MPKKLFIKWSKVIQLHLQKEILKVAKEVHQSFAYNPFMEAI